MVTLRIILMIAGGTLFFISVAGHLFVRIKLRPRPDELEEYYYEFEQQLPAMRQYEFWHRITLACAVASMLLLFLALVF